MQTKREHRLNRRRRVRAKVIGTAQVPRLAVFRSNRNILVQLIDDAKGVTVGSAQLKGKNVAAARELGAKVAQLAKEKGIGRIVFDRGGYRYHGGIKALADAAREGGLKF